MFKKSRNKKQSQSNLDQQELDLHNIPKHVAIIMDGNGRWAKQRKLPRIKGHYQGMQTVKKITKEASNLGLNT